MKFKFQIIQTIVGSLILLQIHTENPFTSCPSPHTTQSKAINCLPPENVGLAHKKVIQYYENGCFEKELERTVRAAKKKFTTQAKHDKQIVVFDIDETILSDYCNIKINTVWVYTPNYPTNGLCKLVFPAIPVMKDFLLVSS